MLLLADNAFILTDAAPIFTKDGLIGIVVLILIVMCWVRDTSSWARFSFVAWATVFVIIAILVVNVFTAGERPEGKDGKAVAGPKAVNGPVLSSDGLRMLASTGRGTFVEDLQELSPTERLVTDHQEAMASVRDKSLGRG